MSRPDAATIPTPRPDPVPALAALAARIEHLRRQYADAERALSPVDAARLRRMLRGTGCADCGACAVGATGQCQACAIADHEAALR